MFTRSGTHGEASLKTLSHHILRNGNCVMCGKCIGKSRPVETHVGQCCENCFLETFLVETTAEAYIAEALVAALDLREGEVGLHSKRVACFTFLLAQESLPEQPELRRQIYWGALLHDVGKAGIRDEILLKTDPLSDDEWVEMRTHPEKGFRIVTDISGMQDAANIVLCHEERFNGSGYPRGLSGDDIPWGARIFAVIDTVDAITSDRPYRKALSFDEAIEEIERLSGSRLDPQAIKIFLDCEYSMHDMVACKCGMLVSRYLVYE